MISWVQLISYNIFNPFFCFKIEKILMLIFSSKWLSVFVFDQWSSELVIIELFCHSNRQHFFPLIHGLLKDQWLLIYIIWLVYCWMTVKFKLGYIPEIIPNQIDIPGIITISINLIIHLSKRFFFFLIFSLTFFNDWYCVFFYISWEILAVWGNSVDLKW